MAFIQDYLGWPTIFIVNYTAVKMLKITNILEKVLFKQYITNNLGITPDICREKYIKKRIRSSIIRETKYAY